MSPSWRRPPALKPGDRVAVVAPASPFDRALLDQGLAELRDCGFDPVFDPSVFDRTGYLAGTPQSRAAALRRAWEDDGIAAIFAARGGYGSVQLLPYLEGLVFRAKIFVGSSDITSLQTWLLQRAGIVTFCGPMVAGQMSRGADGYDRDVLLRTLARLEPIGELPAPALETLRPGEAVGPIVGGTLTQLAASLGTPYAFDPPSGSVLFLEDVGERPYRIDRLVTQLVLSGVMARVRGIVLGTFPGCDEPGTDGSARQTLASLFESFPGPVVFGLPAGHVEGPAVTVPLGARVRVVGDATPRVVVEEAAVA